VTDTLPLGVIRPNPDQPRRHFDEAALGELADSILAVGVLEPIVVRPIGWSVLFDDRGRPTAGPLHYQIVAGERRWRAAKLAGLETIPAIVREGISADDAFVLSLVENCIREDMNPLEEAEGFERLIEAGLDVEMISTRTGKKVASIRSRLALLRLAPPIRDLVRTGQMDAYDGGHLSRLSFEGQFRVVRAMRDGAITRPADVARLAGAVYAQEAQPELFGLEEIPAQSPEAQRAKRQAHDELGRALVALDRAAEALTDLPPESAAEIALLAEEAQRRCGRLVREANGRRIAVVARQLTTAAVA
jgi:ParB family chromosome partitioning protein